MMSGNIEKEEYLIVGGVTKAATTSLHHYLADHPQVLQTIDKECNFWTDPGYNPKRKRHKLKDLTFEECFPTANGEKIKLDVTPNYLHSKGTAQRLLDSDINFKIIFCLREPISRLGSFYGYTKQLGVTEENTSLDSFIEKLLSFKHSDDYENERLFRSVFEGKYWHYLQVYLQLFPGNVKVIFFEDLKSKPENVLKEIADFAGIDTTFYQGYQFNTFNKTRTIANKKVERKYHALTQRISGIANEQSKVYALGRAVKNRLIEPLVYWLNGGFKKPKMEISAKLKAELIDYYAEDIATLSKEYTLPEAWKKTHGL